MRKKGIIKVFRRANIDAYRSNEEKRNWLEDPYYDDTQSWCCGLEAKLIYAEDGSPAVEVRSYCRRDRTGTIDIWFFDVNGNCVKTLETVKHSFPLEC